MKTIVPCVFTVGGLIPKNKYNFFLNKISKLYLNDTSNEDIQSRRKFIKFSIEELKNKPLVLYIKCRNGYIDSDVLIALEYLKLTFIFRISPFIDSNGLNINEHSICSNSLFGIKEIMTDGKNQPVICISDVLQRLKSIKEEYEKPLEKAPLKIHNDNLSGTIARMKLERKDHWEILEKILILQYNYEFPKVPPLIIS
jgi:hypothetical protein